MKKIFMLMGLLSNLCFGAMAHSQTWESGYTLFAFFQKYNIPTSVYYNLPPKDKELTSEIYAGVTYYTLLGKDDELLQALIPIGDGMQIHIFKREDSYTLDFTPMIYFEQEQTISLSIQKSPYQDLMEMTHDSGLVGEFLNAYKNSVNFRSMMKNDRLALIYERKYRLGKPLKNAAIKAAVVEINKKPHYIFRYNQGRYYNQDGKEIQGFLLQTPVAGARISSRFSLGRKHPILGTVRPHYAVDYAAPKGTPIVAAADGVVIFAGKRGGYGNLIEIRHEGNLKTLYAHMNSFASGMRVGKAVKRGQLIGRVGSTGLSTGPHLHFGLYRNNVPINPLSSVKAVSKELQGKDKETFIELTKQFMPYLQEALVQSVNTITPSTEPNLPDNTDSTGANSMKEAQDIKGIDIKDTQEAQSAAPQATL
ncbi:peptidoglycan DD-metalloendopeptidase family protein [Helicobacter typhlonius]|uniref:M23 family metallopeptidase n=1 Tax=Helicobacter typhlonius TaxID=76936 RepID=A0A0S4PXU2_9HELI|nr:peptidoglycan DD-metalloendopeptidase family protein [Helicobacter typhlonius]TLD79209.1 M23 family metallopeptidase [Helicobacter typhlonius]CUU40551.1 Membrane proteins related to metalloendopeptidases [Helicobacter typhlonius]HCD73033.1 M23 family peptidase [Helicobacter sp.]